MALSGDDRGDLVILAVERGSYVRIENLESRSLPVVPGEKGFYAR